MLVSIFLMFKCLTRGCQCERWGWWRSKKGPGKSSFVFLVHIYNIHRSRNLPNTRGERRRISVLTFLKYISTYLPGLGCDVPKMSREKEDPVPQTNTGSLAVCLKIFKIFLETGAKSNLLNNFVNIRSSTCPRPSWVHSPSSMLSTKSWPSCQMKISHQVKIFN